VGHCLWINTSLSPTSVPLSDLSHHYICKLVQALGCIKWPFWS
jgi:hypothetical protein